jgi:hypothetical protein
MARIEMQWKDERLYLGTRSSNYSIVPDEYYPQMWRVRRPNGSLSDMVNRTRAKDAAVTITIMGTSKNSSFPRPVRI